MSRPAAIDISASLPKVNAKFVTFCLIVLFSTILNVRTFAQFKKENFAFSGYLENLNTIWIKDVKSRWNSMGSINNRLNLKWYPDNHFTLSASARNIFTFGDIVYNGYPYYTKVTLLDYGWADMTIDYANDSSYFFYTNIDRANLKYSSGKFEMTLGRQRINWGVNMIWNPNDIFNTYSFYDFSYVERPGCDAARLQLYTGAMSSAQVAVKVDHNEKITAAGMYKFNKWNYDFQFLGGVMTDNAVLGAGWAGNIKGAGFTGEASYFRDIDNFADTTGTLILSVSVNYIFSNSLFLNASFLLNSVGTTGDAGWGSPVFLITELSPLTYTLAKYSIFGEISYPVTPLIKADLATIFNPNDKSAFVGPNITFSLSDNISLLLMSQIFVGRKGTEFGDYGSIYYLDLKWSF